MDANFRALQDFLPRMEAFDITYVEQAVIGGSRNIYGYPLLPACDRKTRRCVEYVLRTAFQRKQKELGGKYLSLVGLSPNECEALDSDPLGLMPAFAEDGTFLLHRIYHPPTTTTAAVACPAMSLDPFASFPILFRSYS